MEVFYPQLVFTIVGEPRLEEACRKCWSITISAVTGKAEYQNGPISRSLCTACVIVFGDSLSTAWCQYSPEFSTSAETLIVKMGL